MTASCFARFNECPISDSYPAVMTLSVETSQNRIDLIDALRGTALVAMIVFHLFRDLEIFGVLASGTTATGSWAVAARLIAGSFMFLVGVSLVLAHGGGIRLTAFARRAAVLALAALAVTLGTWAAMPERMIYFGILHSILVASILGLSFTRLPAFAALAAAVGVLLLWALFGRSLPLDPWFGWTGLAAYPRPALDLIPVVPWLAVTLIGIATAKAVPIRSLPNPNGAAVHPLGWIGRHSLAIYLLHQPLMIGGMWLALWGW